MEFFPFRLYCDHERGWSASQFKNTFMKVKPAGLTWYGYDVIIHSPTEIEFVVFEMYDNFSGGVGNEIARFTATVSRSVTDRDIRSRSMELAVDRRRHELCEAEAEIINRYANEFLAALDRPM